MGICRPEVDLYLTRMKLKFEVEREEENENKTDFI